VIVAACELFTTQGYESTTMADVARRAEVSVGTLYHYFESKRDLLLALAMEEGREMIPALFGPEIQALPFEQRAAAMIDAVFRHCDEHKQQVGLLRLHLDPETEVARWAKFSNQFIDALTPFFQDGMDRGVFNPMPAEMAARLMFGLVDSAIHQCFVLEGGARQEEYKSGLVTIIERTLIPCGHDGRRDSTGS
jgi:AcrR family transcriptional regulator